MKHPTNNHIYLIIVKNSEVRMLVVHSGAAVLFSSTGWPYICDTLAPGLLPLQFTLFVFLFTGDGS